MPPLSLAPWEIPEGMPDSPEGPAHVVHPIPWKGGSCEFLFRLVEVSYRRWFVFARPVESQDEGNWVVCRAYADSPPFIVSHDESELITSFDYPGPDLEFVPYVEDIVSSLCTNNLHLALARLIIVNVEGEVTHSP